MPPRVLTLTGEASFPYRGLRSLWGKMGQKEKKKKKKKKKENKKIKYVFIQALHNTTPIIELYFRRGQLGKILVYPRPPKHPPKHPESGVSIPQWPKIPQLKDPT